MRLRLHVIAGSSVDPEKMDYIVRTEGGELRFQTLEEVQKSVSAGLVERDDSIRMPETGLWTPVDEIPELKPKWWARINHWHVLTATLIGTVLMGGGMLMLIGVMALHGLWFVYVKKGGSRKPRRG